MAITTAAVDRDMGRHDAQIENLEREVSALRGDVREIREILDRASGGWRVMMGVAGVSGVLGASSTKILEFFSKNSQ